MKAVKAMKVVKSHAVEARLVDQVGRVQLDGASSRCNHERGAL